MNESASSRNLKEQHQPEAIRRQLNKQPSHSHLGDAAIGGWPDMVIIALGFANLLADGFGTAAATISV